MEVGSNVGIPVGAGAVGLGTYYGARKVARGQTMQDVGSAVGAVVGTSFEKLPVAPKVVAAFYGRRMTRTIIDTHAPHMNRNLRDFLIDGVGADLGMQVRDPNKVIASLGKHSRMVAEAGAGGLGKISPKLGQNADEVVEHAAKLSGLIARNGVSMVNTAIGARLGRAMLGLGAVGVGVGGAVAGAIMGKELTSPPVNVPVEKIWNRS